MQPVSLPRPANRLGKAASLALPVAVAVAALAAGAAYAGADTTFSPALTKFTLSAMISQP